MSSKIGIKSEHLLEKIDSDLRQFYEVDNSSLSKYIFIYFLPVKTFLYFFKYF